MRRIGLLLLTVTLAGCDALRDAFSAHADEAARASQYTLSTDRLAELVAHAKRVPLKPAPVSSIAQLWVDYSLFALAVARGDSLSDSATVLASTWPLVAQLKWERLHDQLMVREATLSSAQVDSAYRAGNARLFQHLLLRVPPNTEPDVEQQQRTRMSDLRRSIRANAAAFAPLAAQFSEDPATKGRGGYLGVVERNDPLVPEFADAAWALGVGELSDVVRSAYGYHLIRRPPLREVREAYQAGVEGRLQRRLDSIVVDSLAATRDVEVVDDAPQIVRQMAERLHEGWDDRRVLVKFKGGPFRVSDLTQWLHAIDPQALQSLPRAPDEDLVDLLRLLTQRHILVLTADAAGISLDAADLDRLRAEHDSGMAAVRRVLQLSPEALSAAPADGEDIAARVATANVNDYLERLLSGRAAFVPVPPFLAAHLRRHARWEVSTAGVAEAIGRATASRAAADSLSAGRQEEPGLQPAPGPAPVPGGGR